MRSTSGLSGRRISCRPRRTSSVNGSPGVLARRSRRAGETTTNGRTCRSSALAAQQAILHAHRVLVVRHHDGFFEHDAVELERPHRDAMVEAELLQVAMRLADDALIRRTPRRRGAAARAGVTTHSSQREIMMCRPFGAARFGTNRP